MGSTGAAIYAESAVHASNQTEVTDTEWIDKVALVSTLLNFVNIIIVHQYKRAYKQDLLRRQIRREERIQRESSRALPPNEEPSRDSAALPEHSPCETTECDSSMATITNVGDSRIRFKSDLATEERRDELIVKMSDKEEDVYQSRASKDAILITIVHLFFDLLLRLSVLVSAILIKYWGLHEFDYYCSYFIASVMIVTVIPVLVRTFSNMRGTGFDMRELVDEATPKELSLLKKNSMVIHEGKKNLLLIQASEELKLRVKTERAARFCEMHGLEKIVWGVDSRRG